MEIWLEIGEILALLGLCWVGAQRAARIDRRLENLEYLEQTRTEEDLEPPKRKKKGKKK